MRLILAGPSELASQASRPRKTVFVLVTLVAGLLVSSACEKVPLLAPSLTTITLSAASTIVQTNGSTEIRATLLEQSGTPVQNGTTVTFSTTLGTIEPREARTLNGTATVRFVATGQSGEAEIRAASGGAKPADTANPSIKIKVGAAAASRIQLNASPNRVGASGGTATITATVSDTSGNPLAEVPVTFSSDAGTLSSSVATTSSTGVAQVTLSTNRRATVTATTGATTGTAAVSGTVVVNVTSLQTLTIAVITPSPVEDQPVVFTITVGSASDTTDPLQSVVVNFGDGTSISLGGLTAGVTSASHVYSSDGSYTVTATGTGFSGDTTSASAIVTVIPRPPITLTLSANPTSAAVAANITFTVTAPTTGTLARNVTLNFGDGSTVSLGAITASNSVVHAYAAAGTYTVRATATDTLGGSSTVSTQVVITPRVPIGVTIATTPASGPFPNANPVTFTATPTPNTNILRYEWNFGDGSTATTTGNITSRKYTLPSGSSGYTVTVTVTTTDGNTGSGQIQIVVT